MSPRDQFALSSAGSGGNEPRLINFGAQTESAIIESVQEDGEKEND